MLQWMGGSRRKVSTSRGSTQKRQRQYFEQRRRQLQQQTSGSDNYLVDNGCSTSTKERRSLDVLSLKTLSTVAQEGSLCSKNGEEIFVNLRPEATEVNAAGNKYKISAPQPKIHTHSGDPSKSPMKAVSREVTACEPPCSDENILKSSDANHDPWKSEISVLDILEDDGLRCNFRENSMHEDHVSFSVRGLGEVRTETPLNSPPHRMDSHGGSSCMDSSRNVEMFSNLPNDIELEVDAVLKDIDTSLTSKSSKFCSYKSGQVEPFENEKLKTCFPDDMQFDKFDSRFRGAICGERGYHINEEYKKNRYIGANFTIDDFLYDVEPDLPWDDGPQREYKTEDCWKSPNLLDESFKRPQFFGERDMEIPIDGFNLTESLDGVFPSFPASERSIYFEEDLPRNPAVRKNTESIGMTFNPQCFHAEDPKDSFLSSSEESCSSSAVRKDIMDPIAITSDSKIIDKKSSSKGDTNHYPKECGDRNYAQQGKNDGGKKVDTVKFEASSLPSHQPSSFTINNKAKARDSWLVAEEKSQSDVDSGFTSFSKHSMMRSPAYGNEPWPEGSMSAYADAELGVKPKLYGRNSKYAPRECAPFTPFIMETHDSPRVPNLSLDSDVKCTALNSFGVIKSPENYKPTLSVSGYTTKDWVMKSENRSADVIDCKFRKRKIDFFGMRVVQIRDEEEGSSCKTNNEKQRSRDFGEVMKASSATNSDKRLISDNENEYQCEEAPILQANGSEEAETAVADPKEPKTVVRKNTTSLIDRVLMRQGFVIQFACVQQALIEKAEDIR